MQQIKKQTHKEKIATYSKLPKKQLIEMLIEANKSIIELSNTIQNNIINNLQIEHKPKIKSILKGTWDESKIFYSTEKDVLPKYKVDEIKEESKQVETDKHINIYKGYIAKKPIFEIGATTDITIIYKT